MISIALVYVAVVTPYEVAFLETSYNALFWINRFIDVLFAVDMVLQFFIAVPGGEGGAKRRVRRRG